MTNWYAEAIEILAGVHEDDSYADAVKLISEITKRNPKALVDAWRRLHPGSKSDEQSRKFLSALEPFVER